MVRLPPLHGVPHYHRATAAHHKVLMLLGPISMWLCRLSRETLPSPAVGAWPSTLQLFIAGDSLVIAARYVVPCDSCNMTRLIAHRQEQELECLGMAWYRSLLVLAVKRHPHESYQVRFFFHFLCYLRCLQGATHHTARHAQPDFVLSAKVSFRACARASGEVVSQVRAASAGRQKRLAHRAHAVRSAFTRYRRSGSFSPCVCHE